MKNTIRRVLNYFNYDIIRLSSHGTEKYKKNSDTVGLSYYDTPVGKYYLPANIKKDLVANAIKNGTYFEPYVINLAKEHIKKDTSVLDVGANYGQMSIEFSKLTGIGKIYSFEAEPHISAILKKNILVNNRNNIEVIDGAVYNTVGEDLVFPEPDFIRFDSYGSYGVSPNIQNGRKVKTITIDSLNIQDKISFMKVDVQGSDLFAMQGATYTILKNKMPILFEFEEQFQTEFGTTFNDYVEFVKSINYKFVEIISSINYLIVPNH